VVSGGGSTTNVTFSKYDALTPSFSSSSSFSSSPKKNISGFIKPVLISDQLALFLGKPAGTKMARTDVTKEINTYIRVHGLQCPYNCSVINPDEKLRKLLRLSPNDELTYFNFQKYMKPHFHKEY